MTKLKPCPFCGSKAYEESCDRLVVIGCEECGYSMSVYKGGLTSKTDWYDKYAHKKAYEKWNRRSDEHENSDKKETR